MPARAAVAKEPKREREGEKEVMKDPREERRVHEGRIARGRK